jgi:hypothetical protein
MQVCKSMDACISVSTVAKSSDPFQDVNQDEARRWVFPNRWFGGWWEAFSISAVVWMGKSSPSVAIGMLLCA